MASWLENLSIRSRIILLMMGVALPVAALLTWLLAIDVRRTRDAGHEKVWILATGTVADLQRVLDRFESVMARVAARPMVRALDPARCDPLVAEYLQLSPMFVGYAVRDAWGNVVCRHEPAPAPSAIVTDAASAEPALPAGAFGVSDLSVDARTGRKIVALSHPVRDDRGRQIGQLLMTVDLVALNTHLLDSTPERAVVTVVDRTGAVLLRSADLDTFIGTRPAAGEPDPSKGLREGFVAAKGRDGVPRLLAFQTLPRIGWRVDASLPEDQVFVDYRAAITRTIGIAVGLCLALGLAWRLAVRPLYTVILRDITERKKADQDLRASASKLQAALSSMSDAVCISDVDGRLVEFNDAFAGFHGFADKSGCSRMLADYPRILEMVMRDGGHAPLEDWPLHRALRGQVGTNVEYLLRRKDTGRKWIGSYSFAPMRSDNGTITGAVMTARDVTAIREVQLDLASSHFALQRLIASRDQVQEEERKRIARELHDDLQQTLAAIRMDLHVIGERFGAGAPDLPALVAGADRLAERAVVSTRRIVNDLRPPMLEDLGLVTALEAMAHQFSQQSGIACRIDAADDVSDELLEESSVAICLYRVAQEALNNVAKHSRAREVHIRLVRAPANSISLRVRDDGQGMQPADSRKLESFGILGMRERVRAHGGVMHIESSPGAGTVLGVLLPLNVATSMPRPSEPGRSGDCPEATSASATLDDPHTMSRLLSRATDNTLQDVIDAISGIVAVMDRRGTIRFVNRAWTQFADCNGNPGTLSIGPGASYLEVCRRSSLDDATALNILRGLEQVLFEGRAAFTCEYACHSRDELRWFRMHATPMANGDVMVAHFLIRTENAIGVH